MVYHKSQNSHIYFKMSPIIQKHKNYGRAVYFLWSHLLRIQFLNPAIKSMVLPKFKCEIQNNTSQKLCPPQSTVDRTDTDVHKSTTRCIGWILPSESNKFFSISNENTGRWFLSPSCVCQNEQSWYLTMASFLQTSANLSNAYEIYN